MVRLPQSILDSCSSAARQKKLVLFTCNKCGGRSARLVSVVGMTRGVVFARCQHCAVWHTLASNNPAILEEIRFADDDNVQPPSSTSSDEGNEGGAPASSILPEPTVNMTASGTEPPQGGDSGSGASSPAAAAGCGSSAAPPVSSEQPQPAPAESAAAADAQVNAG